MCIWRDVPYFDGTLSIGLEVTKLHHWKQKARLLVKEPPLWGKNCNHYLLLAKDPWSGRFSGEVIFGVCLLLASMGEVIPWLSCVGARPRHMPFALKTQSLGVMRRAWWVGRGGLCCQIEPGAFGSLVLPGWVIFAGHLTLLRRCL